MDALKFSDLPDTARIWIYGSEQPLTEDQVNRLEQHLSQFLAQWQSHERPVMPACQLEHNRFVILAADESTVTLSGCSIDSMVRNLRDFDRATGLNFLGTGSHVFYRDSTGAIRCVDRPTFTGLARQGVIDDQTIVFNNVIQTIGQFRSGHWEVPMRKSWHIDVFRESLSPSS